MIRIDELYSNTFWNYIRTRVPYTRMFFCDPFGHTFPENLFNHGASVTDFNYILFHDQEPIHLDIHQPLFESVVTRSLDCNDPHGPNQGAIVTSELDSEFVEQVCSTYNWRPYYYFFHGWAALDWYRGYDKTFLITPPDQRQIQHTFLAPNRIIAGKRLHRLEMLYHIFRDGLLDNHISCPVICPAENTSIHDAIKPLASTYPDIESVFANAPLPLQFKNETNNPMHSCWLSLFEEGANSLFYLVTETVAQGRRQHITEKTFKPIAMGMPFVLVGTQGCLKYLRSYGFKTFDDVWDESYDNESDDVRIKRIGSLLRSLDELSVAGKQDLFEQCLPIIQHNWNHFYNGGFEQVLWAELQCMLEKIRRDF